MRDWWSAQQQRRHLQCWGGGRDAAFTLLVWGKGISESPKLHGESEPTLPLHLTHAGTTLVLVRVTWAWGGGEMTDPTWYLAPFSLVVSSVTNKLFTAGARILKETKNWWVWNPVNETGLSWPLHLAQFVVSPGVTSTFKWENNNSSLQVDWEWLSWQEEYICIPREQGTSWEWVLWFCKFSHKGLDLPVLRKCTQKQ